MKKQIAVQTKVMSDVKQVAGMTAMMLGASAVIAFILTIYFVR
jgi:hypothetical protein